MTDQHLTTSQLLARHDAKMRARATTAGRPLPRSEAAGLHVAGTVGPVLFTRADAVQVLGSDGSVAPLTFAALREALDYGFTLPPRKGEPREDLVTTIVADPDTLRRVRTQADRWAAGKDTLEAKHMARLLSYRTGLPWSAHLPVLTEALAARYWLPTGPALDSLPDWGQAFDCGTAVSRPMADRLIALARSTTVDNSRKLVYDAIRAERFGSSSARSAADHSACAAFQNASTITDIHAALIACDPMLVERNLIAGSVSRVRVHQVRHGYTEALVEESGKLRSGSRVMVFDAAGRYKPAELTLKDVAFRNDTFSVLLSAKDGYTGREEKNPILRKAHEDRQPLYLTPAPFTMVKPRPKNRRWTNNFDGEAKSLHVDIPADVALAGAPMEASA